MFRSMFKIDKGVLIINFEYIWHIVVVLFAGFKCKWQVEYFIA